MPLRIYTGILGQIGDIVMFTATARRLKELFPNAEITFAVSERYRQAGELVAGLPYVDRLYVTRLYFERLSDELPPDGPSSPPLLHSSTPPFLHSSFPPLLRPPHRYTPTLPDLPLLWELGWPVDLRGADEVEEQRRHDVVLETRPRHRRMPWWEFAHQVEETAAMVGVPGPIDRRTQIAIPPGTRTIPGAAGKIVFHNEPNIDATKAWPWEHVREFVRALGPGQVVLLGSAPANSSTPPLTHSSIHPSCLDLRGRTTLAEAAALIAAARCYVGIDSGLMWIAGSLQVPTVGLYGTSYIPAYGAIQPENPRAVYLQAEGPLDSISPAAVLAALSRALDQGPRP